VFLAAKLEWQTRCFIMVSGPGSGFKCMMTLPFGFQSQSEDSGRKLRRPEAFDGKSD
jgi:hypothetical protein